MKKVIYLLLVAVLIFSLAGCSGAAAPEKSAVTTQVDEQEPEETEEASASEEAEPAAPVPENADIAAIVPRTDTTPENPAAIGEWVETKTYASDQQYHTIYFRITDIVRNSEGTEVQSAIDQYNAAGNLWVFEPLESDDVEYCLLKYQVAYPADFPDDEYGIQTPSIDFSIDSPDGGGIKYNGMSYIGLSSTDIGEDPDDFHSGEIYTDGLALFTMVNGPAEYVISSTYYENDTEAGGYVKGE